MDTPSIYWTEITANAALAFHGTCNRKWRLIPQPGFILAEVSMGFDGAVHYQTNRDWSKQFWARTVRDAMIEVQNSTTKAIGVVHKTV